MDKENLENTVSKNTPGEITRKVYSPPLLKEYGNINELVQGVGATARDNSSDDNTGSH